MLSSKVTQVLLWSGALLSLCAMEEDKKPRPLVRTAALSSAQIADVLAEFHCMSSNAATTKVTVTLLPSPPGSLPDLILYQGQVGQPRVYDLSENSDEKIMADLGVVSPVSSLSASTPCSCSSYRLSPDVDNVSPQLQQASPRADELGEDPAKFGSPVSDSSASSSGRVACCCRCLPAVLAFLRGRANTVHPEKQNK